MDSTLRVQLAVDDDGSVRIQWNRARLERIHITCADLCLPVVQMFVEPVRTRGERRNAPRIDDARPADRHARRGQEIDITADGCRIFQGIDRTTYIDSVVHHVDELIRVLPVLIQQQVGNIVLIEGKFGKGIGRNIAFDLIRRNRPHVIGRRDRARIRAVRLLDVRHAVRVYGRHPAHHAARHCNDRHAQTQRLFLCKFPISAHDRPSLRP